MAIYLRSLAAVVLLLGLSAAAAAESVAPSIPDLLPLYGLPKGLLPKPVKSYSLNSNGEFEVELPAPCYVKFSDPVYYESHIKGKLSYGLISDLSGINFKLLGPPSGLLPITSIVAHPADSTVAFQAGALWTSLPAAQFDEIRGCEPKVGCRGSAARL